MVEVLVDRWCSVCEQVCGLMKSGMGGGGGVPNSQMKEDKTYP